MGYSKWLVTEFIRFSKMFKYTVHVVPFLPPPLCGTNDPELIRSILDLIVYLKKVVKWDLSSYYEKLRCNIFDKGENGVQEGQNTQRHKMPKTIEAYNDVVSMCHPWEDLQSSLPPMDTAIEGNIISTLLMDINNNFKWDLDESPDMSRTLSRANSASEPSVAGVIVGGSNTGLLSDAFNDLGKEVITLATDRWCVSKENVDALLPKL